MRPHFESICPDVVDFDDLYSVAVDPEKGTSSRRWVCNGVRRRRRISGCFEHIENRVEPFTYTPGMPFFSILVPTTESTSQLMTLDALTRNGTNIFFSGKLAGITLVE